MALSAVALVALGGPAAAVTGTPVIGVASGRCLDVYGASTALTTRVIIWDCNGQANQAWTLTSAGELRVYDGTQCLDVAEASTSQAAVVQIYSCTGGSNQKWRVNSDGTIVGVQSGRCLDVTGNSTERGTSVQTWTCHGAGNQRWRTSFSTDTQPPSVPATTTTATQAPITRSGTQLLRGGQPYRFVGFNDDGLFGCDPADARNATDANLDKYFAGLPPASITRVWPYAGSQWTTTLPRVIAAAERHGQYLMVVLSDANNAGSQCFSNAGTAYPADGGAVKTHAANVVSQFKDAPSIAVWEIINEGSKATTTLSWYRSIAAQIRSIDPASVVAFGAGTCYSAVDTTGWNACLTVMGDAANDLIDFHEYDRGPGGSWWTDETQALAARSGKPWMTGEFGFCCNGAPSGLTSDNMGDFIKQEWTSYLNAGASGALYWEFRMGATQMSLDVVTFDKPAWAQVQTYTLP